VDVVYAMDSGHVGGPDGLMVMVRKGTHWPASDPLVVASPGMFSADPRWGLCYTTAAPPEVVEADAPAEAPAPGRRRAAS
jgi:hypothetical protein